MFNVSIVSSGGEFDQWSSKGPQEFVERNALITNVNNIN
jgi:hypothetical protein